jgi:predicted transposase/invertase (TIGR01784 family)
MNTKKIKTNTQRKNPKEMFLEIIRDKYLNPFTDFGFKKLFGEECNKDLLLDFLNELLYEEQGRIVSISYMKTEKLGRRKEDRKAVFDLYCENEKGEKFIVELQKEEQRFFKDRSVYYSTFPIAEQAKKGKWSFELKAVYMIAILDFVFEEDANEPLKYRYDVKLTDIETHKVFYDKLTFIYLEMPKFTKRMDELETRFEKWMYVIKNLCQLDELPDRLRESVFEKIFAVAEVAKLTEEEYVAYARNLKNYWDMYSCITTAESKGIKKGMAKGMKKGIEKGRAEGEAIGEKRATSTVVLNLRKRETSIEEIVSITGLTIEQINEILNQ